MKSHTWTWAGLALLLLVPAAGAQEKENEKEKSEAPQQAEPRPRFTIVCAARCEQRNAPLRLTSIKWSHHASSPSRKCRAA